jgi:hypothetical protein
MSAAERMRLLQARSLALHVMAARKIDAHPELLGIAREALLRWRDRGSATSGAATRAWRKALRLPWPELAALMTEQSESGVRLRTTTPFLHVLSGLERRKVYDGFRVVKSAFPSAIRAASHCKLLQKPE